MSTQPKVFPDGISTGNTAIKYKVLTGTTNSSQGAAAVIVHGLTGDKIVGLAVIVRGETNNGILPDDPGPGYAYSAYYDATNIVVLNSATDSVNILSKPVSILLHYID
jgi:hypothetical protein